ncbi:Acetoacetate metabolism regulatory protein AtoC [Desulfamplus magnetovallimortis]|uniref:Acetoacetate metabolism regulatory protein AtoC n=1 Tax=Desulfamplus magnetovallimortis TaxID=1246637 RepID=A0A1W1HGP4_9BACT|nr:sigma-54 dependent transcriptional regulator [Desulfamplus magnetovallimortis]SLM31552.1 Acetoacetate metabolism regulatory protein AtoC [Desulfamplus magnetovallimortis]
MQIMIVDDDDTQREMLQGFLDNQGYRTLTASNGEKALAIFRTTPVDLALLDNRMPGMTGVTLLEKMKTINPMVHVIMITAFGDINTVITTMKLGAVEFLEKPLDLSILMERIQDIEATMCREEDVQQLQQELEQKELPLKLVAQSSSMKEVLSLVSRVAQQDWPVLVYGETGTGKEVISRLIHLTGNRDKEPFIDINCAAIPENLFESELFGHIKGAFTGASNNRRGCFETAHGGTLFMDEIGELPLALQPKLLRTIQEQKVKKIGSEHDIPVDVRLISATNRDLRQMVEKGDFREDLYYRINVLEIHIPPLRERKTDIPILLDLFLEKYSKNKFSFSPDAVDALIKYPFPGNVRELEHIVQRTVTFARTTVIQARDLPEEVRRHKAVGDVGNLEERLADVEREMIISALEKTGWVQTKAADILGISERVLRYKMKKNDISKQT